MFEQRLLTKCFKTKQEAVDFLFLYNVNGRISFSSVLGLWTVDYKKSN